MLNGIDRIVVLGHRGFIGSHLLESLSSLHEDVECMGISSADADLTKLAEARRLAEHLNARTALVFCSAIVKRSIQGNDLDSYLQNVAMAANVCKVLEDSPVASVCYLSTTAVYGEETHCEAITEDTPSSPNSHYGLAKYSAEWMLRECLTKRGKGTGPTILRLPYVYGPGQKEITGDYGPGMFVRRAMSGRLIEMWGDGEERREFVYIDDVTSIIEQLLSLQFSGVLNVVSGKSRTFQDILTIVDELAQLPVHVKRMVRTKMRVDHAFENGKLSGILPRFTATNLEEGIAKTWAGVADVDGT